MSVHVLLNLLKELGKGLLSILSIFRNSMIQEHECLILFM